MLYYPPFPSWCQHRNCSAMQWPVCARNSSPKDCFQFCTQASFALSMWQCARMNIGKSREIALCARLAYCNKSTQIIRCFSKQPPHNCFRYLLHDLLDPTHSTALQATLLNVVRCSTLPHNQMWFDVAAEVNVGSLRVLSDHIADHTGPDRGAK